MEEEVQADQEAQVEEEVAGQLMEEEGELVVQEEEAEVQLR